jgi:hypothetical protein
MWKLLEHRRPKSHSELLAGAALKELLMYTSSINAESFKDSFERALRGIKWKQHLKIEDMYRCTVQSTYYLEIFKLDASGGIKHIAYTLTYEKP